MRNFAAVADGPLIIGDSVLATGLVVTGIATAGTAGLAMLAERARNKQSENLAKADEARGDKLREKAEELYGEKIGNVADGKIQNYTGGRTQIELDDLARDPSHAGRIEAQGIKEREVGLALEERGDLGKIVRDMQVDKGAEFIDTTTGLKWDVKSFESYPSGDNGIPITNPKRGAFTIKNGMKKIQKEFKNGNNVIIDTRNLVPEHIEQLKKAIDEAGVADRIIWYP